MRANDQTLEVLLRRLGRCNPEVRGQPQLRGSWRRRIRAADGAK